MALPAKNLVDKVLSEVRDPQGMATSRTDVLSLVSRSQQQVNAALDDVVVPTLYIVPPRTLLFPISATWPDAVRILSIRRADGSDLHPLGERADIALTWLDSSWFTSVGSDLRSWGTIGRDLLVLHPGLASSQTITLRYTQLTPTLAVEADPTVVPNEDDPQVSTLAALLIRMKGRDFEGMDRDFTRFKEDMGRLRALKR